MKLSIIIVSWNTSELTLRCAKSIFKYLKNIDLEVFVVDNNSSDDTIKNLEIFKKNNNLNNLYIIKNKNNLGFAKANNKALSLVLSEPSESKDTVGTGQEHFILLLNPDTELIDDSIFKLVNFLELNKDVGLVGPKLLNSDKTLQKSCRRFPKLLDQIFIQLKFYNFFPEKISAIKKYFMLDFDFNEIREVNQIMGAVILIKKEVINKIGLLDEKFWVVFEEVDFCKRAKDAGYKIYFNPECQIIHHKEQSFKQVNNFKKQINFNKSLYYYFYKHKRFYELFILWLFQPINLLLVLLNSIFKIRKNFGKKKDL